jgi:nucleotide sugar dehydrogenase|tara:strand:+ start:1051 stop:1920 length:870 start_codon:yes stop_codon:yes gene_type:complete
MKLKQKIGVVGNGFVGGAVRYGFSPNVGVDAEVRTYDKNPNKSTHTLEETINESDFVFLSVPTPSNKDGSINIDILDDVLNDINNISKKENTILIRSTVTPGTTRKLQIKYHQLNLLFNPEFLTERSANFDFINQSRFVIGSSEQTNSEINAQMFLNLIRDRFGDCVSVLHTNYETAEMIKYMSNCFFATKVSFMNEMYQVAKESNVNWDDAVNGFVADGRIGHSHLNVPGPDGKFGFGGSCFPKDIQAMIKHGKTLGINMDILSSVWNKNLEVRPEKDWEKLKGRAVV